MKRATREGIQWSIGVHLLVLGAVFFMGLLATFFEEEPPLVFELVDLAEMTSPAATVSEIASPVRMEPEVEPTPVPPVEALTVPTFDNLRPVPELPPERIVEPTPAPVEAARPVPPSAPRPVEPAPPPRLSYEEHLKTFGQPKVTPAAPVSRTPEVTIQTNARELLNKIGTPSLTSGSTRMTSAQINALENYADSLAARLQAAFNPLGTNGLVALVEFTVQADGTISPFRIKRSSGNEAFDRSVLSVFQRLGRYRAPPDGTSHSWEINFRSVE